MHSSDKGKMGQEGMTVAHSRGWGRRFQRRIGCRTRSCPVQSGEIQEIAKLQVMPAIERDGITLPEYRDDTLNCNHGEEVNGHNRQAGDTAVDDKENETGRTCLVEGGEEHHAEASASGSENENDQEEGDRAGKSHGRLQTEAKEEIKDDGAGTASQHMEALAEGLVDGRGFDCHWREKEVLDDGVGSGEEECHEGDDCIQGQDVHEENGWIGSDFSRREAPDGQ